MATVSRLKCVDEDETEQSWSVEEFFYALVSIVPEESQFYGAAVVAIARPWTEVPYRSVISFANQGRCSCPRKKRSKSPSLVQCCGVVITAGNLRIGLPRYKFCGLCCGNLGVVRVCRSCSFDVRDIEFTRECSEVEMILKIALLLVSQNGKARIIEGKGR